MNCKKLEIRISHTFYLDIWPRCSLQAIPEIKQEEFGSTVLYCVPDLIASPCAVLNLRLVPVVGLEHLGCSFEENSGKPTGSCQWTVGVCCHWSLIECLVEEILR